MNPGFPTPLPEASEGKTNVRWGIAIHAKQLTHLFSSDLSKGIECIASSPIVHITTYNKKIFV
uniref:Uncharacterized protein n=1 Tax=Candidatus Nitrotoga fabula TaxID=2182327 RepID=A0A2X0QWX2_9PROT|nr:protein of unknown function [Candidatus Nitrotoga fabula]